MPPQTSAATTSGASTTIAIQRRGRRADDMGIDGRDHDAAPASRSRRSSSGRRLQREEDGVLAAADQEEDVLPLLDLLQRRLVRVGVVHAPGD